MSDQQKRLIIITFSYLGLLGVYEGTLKCDQCRGWEGPPFGMKFLKRTNGS